jgi:hypothetical protein
VRARTVPILLAVALAGAGCGSDQVSKQASPTGAHGDAKDSLFRTANFERALGVLRRHVGAGATLLSLRLEAGALTAEVSGGAGRSVVVTKRFKLTSVPTPGVVPASSISLTEINAGAPERMMTQVTPQSGVGLAGVDYFAVSTDPSTGRPAWIVYLQRGKGSYSADLSGTNVKALSGTPPGTGAGTSTMPPATTTPATPTAPPTGSTPAKPATTPSRGQVQKQIQCITRARGDSAKIAACLKSK